MRFGSLIVENFMSVTKAEVELGNTGLVLIQGENNDSEAFESNGAGKSTLFSEAPTWALYGETIRGQKGDKIINRNKKGNVKVSLQIIDSHNDEYIVTRYRKHDKYKNSVTLFRNGKNITGKSDKDTDQMIEDLIGMDYLTFTNSVMFGQGVTKMFASSTDKEQKAILEKMLRIEIYKQCQELAKQRLSGVLESYNSLLQEQNLLRTLKETEEQNLDKLQVAESELEGKCNAAIDEYKQELEIIENKLIDLRKDRDSNRLQSELQDLNSLIEGLRVMLSKYDSIVTEYSDSKSSMMYTRKELGKVKDTIRDSAKKLDDLKSGKNVPKTCSSCGQDLPLNDTTHLQNHLEDDIKSGNFGRGTGRKVRNFNY